MSEYEEMTIKGLAEGRAKVIERGLDLIGFDPLHAPKYIFNEEEGNPLNGTYYVYGVGVLTIECEFDAATNSYMIYSWPGDRKVADALKSTGRLLDAAKGLLDHYTTLVCSGDCGTWDPEEEPPVKLLRSVIASIENG